MFFHPYLFLFCPVLKAKSCQKSTRKHRKSNIGMKIVPNWRLWLQKKTGLWELLLCGLAPYLFLPGRNKTKQNYYEVFIFHSVNMTKNILIMSNCKISGCWGVGGDKGGNQPTVRHTLTMYDRDTPPRTLTMALLPEILGVLLLILKSAG